MKKALVALAVALLAGCLSAPMSSVSGGAKPTHVLENPDGTMTFEFVFPYDDTWNRDAAMQRIKEYLATYARLNGFSGYDTVSAAEHLVSKVSEASAAVDILADAAGSTSGAAAQPDQARFVRVIKQVKFRT